MLTKARMLQGTRNGMYYRTAKFSDFVTDFCNGENSTFICQEYSIDNSSSASPCRGLMMSYVPGDSQINSSEYYFPLENQKYNFNKMSLKNSAPTSDGSGNIILYKTANNTFKDFVKVGYIPTVDNSVQYNNTPHVVNISSKADGNNYEAFVSPLTSKECKIISYTKNKLNKTKHPIIDEILGTGGVLRYYSADEDKYLTVNTNPIVYFVLIGAGAVPSTPYDKSGSQSPNPNSMPTNPTYSTHERYDAVITAGGSSGGVSIILANLDKCSDVVLKSAIFTLDEIANSSVFTGKYGSIYGIGGRAGVLTAYNYNELSYTYVDKNVEYYHDDDYTLNGNDAYCRVFGFNPVRPGLVITKHEYGTTNFTVSYDYANNTDSKVLAPIRPKSSTESYDDYLYRRSKYLFSSGRSRKTVNTNIVTYNWGFLSIGKRAEAANAVCTPCGLSKGLSMPIYNSFSEAFANDETTNNFKKAFGTNPGCGGMDISASIVWEAPGAECWTPWNINEIPANGWTPSWGWRQYIRYAGYGCISIVQ